MTKRVFLRSVLVKLFFPQVFRLHSLEIAMCSLHLRSTELRQKCWCMPLIPTQAQVDL